MKISKITSSLFFILSIAILVGIIWIKKTFGDISYEQFVWHIQNIDTLTAIDPDCFIRGKKFIALLLALFLGTIFIITFGDKILYNLYKIDYHKTYKYTSILSIISLIFSTTLFSLNFLVPQNKTIYKGDFIADNYFFPEKIAFSYKRNIVIVLVESLENSFRSDHNSTSYIPQLEKVQDITNHTSNMTQVYGTGWTIAAATAWHFGLPLKTPFGIGGNSYVSRHGFLPNAVSIFDILQKNGYRLELIMGSDSHFSGTNKLFAGHGNFTISDYNFFLRKGYDLSKNYGAWGYRDAFIFDRSIEKYVQLKKENQPFVLFIQTIDTHTPEGFCPEERKKFFDIRDSIQEADRNLASFLHKIQMNDPGNNDIIIFIGDHLLMGTHDFLKNIPQRTIYNMFYGPVPTLPDHKKDAVISALDIAPTLLHCAGARWENGRFGLGVSLFSEEPSLVEQYGLEKLNGLLNNPSKKYESFY